MYKIKLGRLVSDMFLANLIAGIGSLLANSSSTVCLGFIWDEPECPKALLK